ncbi:hypothetical protein PMEGAPR185_13860 [Priestia megaterium]
MAAKNTLYVKWKNPSLYLYRNNDNQEITKKVTRKTVTSILNFYSAKSVAKEVIQFNKLFFDRCKFII